MTARVLLVSHDANTRKSVENAFQSDGSIVLAGVVQDGLEALRYLVANPVDTVLVGETLPPLCQPETLAAVSAISHACLVALCNSNTDLNSPINNSSIEVISLSSRRFSDELKSIVIDSVTPKHRLHKREPYSSIHENTSVRYRETTEQASSISTPEIVVIGVSTGGPDALARLLAKIPHDFSVPIVIVQHIIKDFSQALTKGLDKKTLLRVVEARDGDIAIPGTVFLVAADRHATLSRSSGRLHIKLNDGPKENFVRPSVDVLFRSAARACGSKTIAVVLTGMGEDGKKGCIEIHKAGGRILAQDKTSSVIWGMPGAVVKAGLADAELPLESIPDQLTQWTRSPIAAAV